MLSENFEIKSQNLTFTLKFPMLHLNSQNFDFYCMILTFFFLYFDFEPQIFQVTLELNFLSQNFDCYHNFE